MIWVTMMAWIEEEAAPTTREAASSRKVMHRLFTIQLAAEYASRQIDLSPCVGEAD